MGDGMDHIRRAAERGRRQRARMASFSAKSRALGDFRSQHVGDAQAPSDVAETGVGTLPQSDNRTGQRPVRFKDTLDQIRLTPEQHSAGRWAQSVLSAVYARANIQSANYEAAQRIRGEGETDEVAERMAHLGRVAARLKALACSHQAWPLVFGVLVESNSIRNLVGSSGMARVMAVARLKAALNDFAEIQTRR